MKSAAAVAVVVLLAAAAAAQDRPRPRQGPPRPNEEAFKMVDAYIVSNLQESLDLTDEQFVKLLPLVKKLQSDRRALAQRRMQAMGELRRTLQSGGSTEAHVAALLRDIKAVEAEEPATLARDRAAVDAALTPLQQAKFRVLEIEVEQRIRRLLEQIRMNRGPQPGRRPGPGPEGPEPDEGGPPPPPEH